MNGKNIVRNAALIVPEYAFKMASIPAGFLAAGAKGNLAGKVASGYSELVTLPHNLYANTAQVTNIAHDYASNMGVRNFADKYGGQAADVLLKCVNGGVEYLQQLKDNLTDHPFQTLAAAAITAGTLYAVGRGLRFFRQKGRGSLLDKIERNCGEKVWPKA